MKINFKLNEKNIKIDIDPMKTLLKVLRENLEMKDVKEGCGEGECGACAVLLDGIPITSCTLNICNVDGKDVKTPSFLGKTNIGEKIIEAFDETNSVQCGFCFPGFLVSSYYYLKNINEISEDKIKETLSGNICRCTGYEKVIDSVMIAVRKYKNL